MRRRPGVTLVEVLAAMAIMAIGMLAILVLFPMGALAIARSLKDDRCGTIAWNADSLATSLDYRNDAAYVARLRDDYLPPNDPLYPTPVAPGRSDPLGPGYPVFLDPFYNIYAGITPTRNNPSPNPLPQRYLVYPTIPRVTPSVIPTIPMSPPATAAQVVLAQEDRRTAIDRLFAFNDDMGFHLNGYPKQISDGRYTWTYLFKRNYSRVEASAECFVIVYNNRPVDVPAAEQTYGVAADPDYGTAGIRKGQTSFILSWDTSPPVGVQPQDRPALRRGYWLFDTTSATRPHKTGGVAWGFVHAEFYRVMDVSDFGANQVRVEVQPPLRHDGSTQMMHLLGAVEVFERGAKP
ncbi:MAG: prepilin-type N-terminal cleavage/methylation domain-containing protein [Gemmataceae bacterium]